MIGLIGGVAFTPVQNDMNGNIKVRPGSLLKRFYCLYPGRCWINWRTENKNEIRCSSSPVTNASIAYKGRRCREENYCYRRVIMAYTVRYSLAPPKSLQLMTWKQLADIKFHLDLNLFRGLDFTLQAISVNLRNPDEELSTSFRSAYTNTLKPHHSIIVKPIFSAAMSATPYRKDFYKKLGDNQEVVEKKLREWLVGLEETVLVLKKDLFDLNKKWKVWRTAWKTIRDVSLAIQDSESHIGKSLYQTCMSSNSSGLVYKDLSRIYNLRCPIDVENISTTSHLYLENLQDTEIKQRSCNIQHLIVITCGSSRSEWNNFIVSQPCNSWKPSFSSRYCWINSLSPCIAPSSVLLTTILSTPFNATNPVMSHILTFNLQSRLVDFE